jgi:hypothetical protein
MFSAISAFMRRILPLFVLVLLFPILGKRASASQPDLESLQEQIPDPTYLKLMRSIILAEEYVRRSQQKLANTVSVSAEPLTPQEACGECGGASAIFDLSMAMQGVEVGLLHSVHSSEIFGPGAHGHVLSPFRVEGKDARTAILVHDSTFPQFARHRCEGLSCDTEASILEHLARTETGRSLIRNVLMNGFWIATPENIRAYSEAFSINRKTGQPPMDVVVPSEEKWFPDRKKVVSPERAKRHLGFLPVEEQLKLELSRISPDMILERRRAGENQCQKMLANLISD